MENATGGAKIEAKLEVLTIVDLSYRWCCERASLSCAYGGLVEHTGVFT